MAVAARGDEDPVIRYREHAPHPALRPLVECYWSVRGAVVDRVSHRVLPDGCLDLLFDLSSGAADPMQGHTEAAVVGFMTRPLPVGYRGEVELFAVRFRPGRAAGVLGVDTHELTDRVEALDDVWGHEGRTLFERLVAAPTTTDIRARVLDAALLSRLEDGRAATDVLMVEAASRIVRSGGRVRIGDLARSLGISRRQLERRFPATVGASPKTAARVVRFRRVVDALHA
ncbi:MAG: hypothetical protein HKO53_17515, partial [Gemmatimonadetes bacterium]|nr:hypothetical protein [Gemmatimonadota bacterium]